VPAARPAAAAEACGAAVTAALDAGRDSPRTLMAASGSRCGPGGSTDTAFEHWQPIAVKTALQRLERQRGRHRRSGGIESAEPGYSTNVSATGVVQRLVMCSAAEIYVKTVCGRLVNQCSREEVSQCLPGRIAEKYWQIVGTFDGRLPVNRPVTFDAMYHTRCAFLRSFQRILYYLRSLPIGRAAG